MKTNICVHKTNISGKIGVHNIFFSDLRWKPTSVNTKFSHLKPRFSCKLTSVNDYHLHQFYTYTNFSSIFIKKQYLWLSLLPPCSCPDLPPCPLSSAPGPYNTAPASLALHRPLHQHQVSLPGHQHQPLHPLPLQQLRHPGPWLVLSYTANIPRTSHIFTELESPRAL